MYGTVAARHAPHRDDDVICGSLVALVGHSASSEFIMAPVSFAGSSRKPRFMVRVTEFHSKDVYTNS